MTLFAVICAAIFPGIHVGRFWMAWYMAPIPNNWGIWQNFRSALMWDVFAVSTYFTVSVLFWYTGLIPDLATLRDRATTKVRKFLFGIFACGWRGANRNWRHYEMAYLLLAGLSTPLVLSVHSVVSFDFASTVIPTWHTTIFPPYFVAGAIFGGFAMVLTLLLPARAIFKLHDVITPQHVDKMAKIILLTGSFVAYAYSMEFFIAWYSGNSYEKFAFWNRIFGPYWWYWWFGMIPKVIGRPVYSYHLAAIGFWSYALFSSWTGMQRLVDGPFPAWMVTASIAATILTLIPVATVGLNHHMTMQGYFPLMRYSPTLRFTVFGAMSYTVFSLVGVLISLRSVASYVNFTQASIAYSHLGLYAFFTMVIFGSMYYIVPRLIGREWRYGSLIKLHFWASAYGIGLMTLMLLAGGFMQGASMENPSLAFSESVESVLPYLRGRSLSGILLTASHFIFAYHFGLMLFGLGRKSTVPTFLNPVEAEGTEGHL